MDLKELTKKIQRHVGVKTDGIYGPNTAQAILDKWVNEELPEVALKLSQVHETMARAIAHMEDHAVTGPENLRIVRLPASDKGGDWEICGVSDGFEPQEVGDMKAYMDAGDKQSAWNYLLTYLIKNTDPVLSYAKVSMYPALEFFLRDMYFNMGPGGCVKVIQRVCRAKGADIKYDGAIGPATRKAFAEVIKSRSNDKELLESFHQHREAYYKKLVQYPEFGRGWLNRNDEAYDYALQFLK